MANNRFVGNNDLDYMNYIARELIDSIIGVDVALYKSLPRDSQLNIYGEQEGGRYYSPGVICPVLVEQEAPAIEDAEGIIAVSRNIRFKFQRTMLEEKGVYPEQGDVIDWAGDFYEIDNPAESQFIAGFPWLRYNFAIECECHKSRLTSINIVESRNEDES